MIYCVEDDTSIRELMVYTLKASGFEAEGFLDGKSLFDAIVKKKPKLIMLDIMLPEMDGLEILKKLKAKSSTSTIPVIMATAKGTEYDKVMGLDLGADDYLTKPFGMMEMVSRVKAVLRRVNSGETDEILKVGELELNMSEHIVISCGEKIQLTLKEYEMLKLFMKHLGRVYSRDQLLQKIWEADYVGETRTVDVHVGTLRTKLGKCGEYIETIRGVGYRLQEH